MTIRRLEQLPGHARLGSTVAIIGAGPAGITLALELEACGVDVILLEGGGVEFDEDAQQRYAGELDTTADLVYPPLDTWRLRMLGGTSNHWSGWCRRLESNVFEPRPWLGGIPWPFARQELEAGYRRAQQLCQLGRDVYDPAELQSDLGVAAWPELERYGLESSVWRYSPPTLFGERYRDDLERSSIDVLLHANVVGFEATTNAVSSVRVVGEDRLARTVSAEIVVIAAGGLESVRQLLLFDATGQISFNSSNWLGYGFMEHPHGPVGTIAIDEDLATDPAGPLAPLRGRLSDIDGVDIRTGLTITPEACEHLGLPNMSFTIDSLDGRADALTGLPFGTAISELVPTVAGGRRAIPHQIYMRSEQRLERSSRISLTTSRDDLGLQRLRLGWRLHPQDLLDAVAAVEMVAAAFAGLGTAVTFSPGTRAPITGTTGGAHHMGGARMHDDPRHGVVDPTLKVHGVANLFVCSSAVFPAGGYSNPTLTIVALAHRLAQELALR